MLRRGLLKDYPTTVSWIAKFIDVVLCVFVCVLVHAFYLNSLILSRPYQIAIALIAVLIIPIFSLFGLYESFRGRSLFARFFALYTALGTVLSILTSLAFITKTSDNFSRVWLIASFFVMAVLLTLFRIMLQQTLNFFRKKNWNQRRVLIIGASDLAYDLVRNVKAALWTGFNIVELLDEDPKKNKRVFQNIKVGKIPENLEQYIVKASVDEIWITLPLRAESRLEELLAALRHNTITIRYFPDIFGLQLVNHSVVDVLGFPAINLRASPMRGTNRFIKAIEDYCLASIILIVVSPIMVLIALLIKMTSPGPVIYKQWRHGWDGKPICIYKFRSMVDCIENTFVQATKQDKRITTVGKWLRRLSLDELPQLINVLQGKMSLVGPRPHAIEHNRQFKELIPSYMQRHQVKPGIVGWAQINGWRGETDTLEKMRKRIEYDLYYIAHWSFWFDMKILVLGVFKGFIHKNAY